MILSLLVLIQLSCNAAFSLPASERLLPTTTALRVVAPSSSPDQARELAVHAAKSFLAAPLLVRGLRFEPDPVGFVRAAWWYAGQDLYTQQAFSNPESHGLELLYASAKARRALFTIAPPKPGDLIFFGQKDEAIKLSQVALVEHIDPDGTLHVLGRFSKGPRRIAVNLQHPTTEKSKDGKVLNDTLGVEPGKPAGSLFLTYARAY